jgi:hypothetical protein
MDRASFRSLCDIANSLCQASNKFLALFVCKITASSALIFLGWAPWGQSKNEFMPVNAPGARYSLVKGERIVRSELGARLRVLVSKTTGSYALLDSEVVLTVWYKCALMI